MADQSARARLSASVLRARVVKAAGVRSMRKTVPAAPATLEPRPDGTLPPAPDGGVLAPASSEAETPAPAPALVRFRGLPVHVDRPRGYVMNGVGPDGTPWRRVYHVDYGYVPGTLGGDGEGLDVFLGADETATEAHWILQQKADGTFDEYKVMLGFPDPKSARAMYELHVPRKFFGSMCSMPVEMMKALLGIEPVDSIEKSLDGLRRIVESSTAGAPPVTPAPADLEKCVRLAKADPQGELRYVLGVVLEPEVVDAQGDIYSAEEIRKSAWEYMANFRNVGLMHKGLINGKVRLVESYIAQTDMDLDGSTVRKGTWMMGLHVADDEIWAKVKAGQLTGLSIGGFARKTEVASDAPSTAAGMFPAKG